jgi:adenylylsulfate kinase
VARLFNDAGIIAIAAFISPYRDDRELARSTVGAARFIEAYLSADISICEHRDPKGLYKKARAGELADFTGISAPYEAPAHPAIYLDTGVLSVEQCVTRLLQLVLQRARDGHASR